MGQAKEVRNVVSDHDKLITRYILLDSVGWRSFQLLQRSYCRASRRRSSAVSQGFLNSVGTSQVRDQMKEREITTLGIFRPGWSLVLRDIIMPYWERRMSMLTLQWAIHLAHTPQDSYLLLVPSNMAPGRILLLLLAFRTEKMLVSGRVYILPIWTPEFELQNLV